MRRNAKGADARGMPDSSRTSALSASLMDVSLISRVLSLGNRLALFLTARRESGRHPLGSRPNRFDFTMQQGLAAREHDDGARRMQAQLGKNWCQVALTQLVALRLPPLGRVEITIGAAQVAASSDVDGHEVGGAEFRWVKQRSWRRPS